MQFTNDWADHYRDTWARCPALQDFRPQRWLEVGTYEGRSACWMMETKLAPGGLIACVDKFRCFPGQEAAAFSNLTEASENSGVGFSLHAGTLEQGVWGWPAAHFDGCYIDGPKDYDGALETSRAAWDLVRAGGVLIWDDIHWDEPARVHDLSKISPVGLAVQTLLAEKGLTLGNLAWHTVQAVLVKPAA